MDTGWGAGEAGGPENTVLEFILPFQTFTSVELGSLHRPVTHILPVSLSFSYLEQLNPLCFLPYLYPILKTLNNSPSDPSPSPTVSHVTILAMADTFLGTWPLILVAP